MTQVYLCGTRAVIESVTIETGGHPVKGVFEVQGATSGHVIHRYPYDERRAYSDAFLTDERAKPGGVAWKKLASMTVGKLRDEAKQKAITKATDTSAVVTQWDR